MTSSHLALLLVVHLVIGFLLELFIGFQTKASRIHFGRISSIAFWTFTFQTLLMWVGVLKFS